MKKLGIIGVVLFLLLLIAVIWWPSHSESVTRGNTPGKPAKMPGSSASTTSKTNAPLPKPSREERLANALENLNVAIKFWGKVVDQDDNPLSGVIIKGYVMHDTVASPYGYSLGHFEIATSKDGHFEITDVSGSGLTIESIVKEGYELSKNVKTHFGYRGYAEKFTPDQNNPVVFKMWERHGAEPLVKCYINIGIPCDGTPVLIDFLKNKKVDSGGNLRITFKREPLHIQRGKDKGYDWTLLLEAIDGEILDSTEEFMYMAPEAGYKSSLQIEMLKTDPNWISILNKPFYLKLQDGKQFARVNLELYTNFEPPPTSLQIESWLNPSGSRNLEYDSKKSITPQRIAQIGLEKAIEEARDPDERQRKYDASLGIPSSGK